jgi:hypothetical protein
MQLGRLAFLAIVRNYLRCQVFPFRCQRHRLKEAELRRLNEA